MEAPDRTGELLERLVREELPSLYRVASRATGNLVLAEDLVGQCLLNAAQSWSEFDGRFPRAWLLRILHRCFLMSMRSAARHPSSSLNETDLPSENDLHEQVHAKILVESVIASLEVLSPEYKMAIVLCDIEEISYKDAATALGVSIGTLSSWVHRARRQLQAELGSDGEL